MAYDYGYGELENELIDLLRTGAPDLEAAARLVEQGADLNAEGKNHENVLSEILMLYRESEIPGGECGSCRDCNGNKFQSCKHTLNPNPGASMIKIIQFFLDHGFDVHKRNEQYGAHCLFALLFSSFDEHMIDALKLLFDAGAKNVIHDDQGLTPMRDTMEELGCQDFNYHMENVFDTMYQIYLAHEAGRPYDGICLYAKACGKTITKVLAEKPETGPVFFDSPYPGGVHKNAFRPPLYLLYDGGVLFIDRGISLWTDTMLPKKELLDVSDHFSEIIGSTITGITLRDIYESEHWQPIAALHMSNRKDAVFAYSHWWMDRIWHHHMYFFIEGMEISGEKADE